MVKRLAPRLVLIQDIQIVKSLPAILLQGNQPNITLQGDKAQVRLSGSIASLVVTDGTRTITLKTDSAPQMSLHGSGASLTVTDGTRTSTLGTAQLNLSGNGCRIALNGALPNITLTGATPSLTLAHTEQTVSLRVDSSAQKISLPEWSGYLAWLKSGNLIPVGFAKHIAEVSTTGTIVLDQLFVLASSIPPNTQMLLYLRADVYNNGGYTTCIRASFSDATVQLCTTATAYTTLTGSATVNTLTDGWLILDVSSVAGGTAYVKNAVALLVPRTT